MSKDKNSEYFSTNASPNHVPTSTLSRLLFSDVKSSEHTNERKALCMSQLNKSARLDFSKVVIIEAPIEQASCTIVLSNSQLQRLHEGRHRDLHVINHS
jgi:hypothetical protein